MSYRTKKDLISTIDKPFDSVKKIACATLRVEYTDRSVAIRYHDTDVVTYFRNGDFIVTSGGFRTKTTRARIYEHAGIRAWVEQGIWYFLLQGKTLFFYDGMRFDKNHVRYFAET